MSKIRFSIGIDVTYTTHLDVEAKNIYKAVDEANKFARHLDTPRGCRLVGVATHSERIKSETEEI